MKFRFAALLVALPAVIAGLLVSAPADAASYYAFVKTKNVAISSTGEGRVYMTCASTHTCKGKLTFKGDSRSRSYSVAGKTSKYVAIAATLGGPFDPVGGTDHGDYTSKPARILVNEDSPKNIFHEYGGITTETPVLSQQITGTVNLHGTPQPTDVRVEMFTVDRGGSPTRRYVSPVLTDGQTFTLNAKLGINNASSSAYRIRISGKDQNGRTRSWYWRGSDGSPQYGGKYLRDGSAVTATKYQDFNADFHTGTVKGSVDAGYGTVDVTVAAPPSSYSSSSRTNRDLDISNCANIFGETTVANGSGNYAVNFLPYVAGSRHYIVRADDHTSDQARWNGNFGSCFDVLTYSESRTPVTTNLIVPNGVDAPNSSLTPNPNTLTVNGDYASSATSQGDRFIRLRERVPNASILEAPVVAQGAADSAGRRTFTNLPAG
ncbi:MAG: hypothetical protein ABIN55_13280, partial [Aeromicrobium sp.]